MKNNYTIKLRYLSHTDKKPCERSWNAVSYSFDGNIDIEIPDNLYIEESKNHLDHGVYSVAQITIELNDVEIVEITDKGCRKVTVYRLRRKKTPNTAYIASI